MNGGASRALYLAVKRLVDIAAASLGLLILSPLLLGIAAVIRLTSPGPAFYRGLRSGMGGVPFRMLKFRTMVADAERIGGPSTGKNDPRVTPIGRFLRAHKLDELPQLINVLRGEMSLVGPRPEVLQYTQLYEGEEKLILTVKPGITDFASIEFIDLAEHLGSDRVDHTYERNVKPVKNQLRIRYVREQGLRTDARILVRTLLHIVGVNRRIPNVARQ